MKSGIFFTLLLTFIVYPLLAQEEGVDTEMMVADSIRHSEKAARDSVRQKYVKMYPDHFFIWPVIKKRTLELEAKSLLEKNHKVLFKPNSSVSMGLGLYLFEVAAELTFTVKPNEHDSYRFGQTHSSDFQINALGKYWGFDVYRQKYRGFYVDDNYNPTPKDKPFPQRPDIRTRNFGVSGIYTFNRDRFSFRSSFNFAEQQLYSKGSWFVATTINSFYIIGDQEILSIANRDKFSADGDFSVLRYTTFGVAPGYSQNFVYKNFFLNITLGIGPAHNWTYLRKPNGEVKNDISINTISVLRIGLGYNSDQFFAGIGFANQSRNVVVQDVRITNSTGFAKIIIGFRFKESGVLKKRLKDFIPFKIT